MFTPGIPGTLKKTHLQVKPPKKIRTCRSNHDAVDVDALALMMHDIAALQVRFVAVMILVDVFFVGPQNCCKMVPHTRQLQFFY